MPWRMITAGIRAACFLLAAVISMASLAGDAKPREAKSSVARLPASATTNRYEIRGMHCDGCARGIQGELKLLPGVLRAEVSYPRRLAVVVFDTNQVDSVRLVRAVKEAGFEAELAAAPAEKPRRR